MAESEGPISVMEPTQTVVNDALRQVVERLDALRTRLDALEARVTALETP